ncbi:MAG: ribonuclease R, partial [Planctomycetes bacterium]|nr:ribonuclease R [Planctomycetota bacterium]
MSPERYSEGILKHLADSGYRPQKLRQLARAMGIAEAEYGDFRDAIKALRQTGRVVLGGRNALMLPEPAREIVGHFRANPRGFGFVIPESAASHGDLFVPPGQTMGAITGDLVGARVLKKGKRDGRMIFEGRVTEIIQR